jgi:hypothetical protein
MAKTPSFLSTEASWIELDQENLHQVMLQESETCISADKCLENLIDSICKRVVDMNCNQNKEMRDQSNNLISWLMQRNFRTLFRFLRFDISKID